VFGSSNTAQWMVRKLQSQSFRVEALWSRVFSEAEAVASDLHIPFYTSRVDDVLLRPDVGLVVILCPPNLHSQIAVKALGIGKHVLCGIPGSLNQAEFLRMVQAGQYYPSLMAVLAYSLRFHPGTLMMKDKLHSGYLGERISLVDMRISCGSLLDPEYSWLCDAGMGGGVLSLLGSHLLDLVSFLQLGRVTRVHANLNTMTRTTDNIKGIRSITAEDCAVLQLNLTSGCLVNISINSVMSGFSQEVVICGSAGYLAFSNDVVRARKNGASSDQVFQLNISQSEEEVTASGLPPVYSAGMVRMIQDLKEEFQARAEGRTRLRSAASFADGLYVQAVIEAMRRSNQTRQWSKVEMYDEDSGMGGLSMS